MSRSTFIPGDFFVSDHVRYVFIDGHFCKRMRDCYFVLRQQLSLPDWFGNNLDALEEALGDLEWIPEKEIKLVILNTGEWLADEPEHKEAFLDVLQSCENEKVEVLFFQRPQDADT